MSKKKIYYWASDIRINSGEGMMAIKFIKDLKNNFINHDFVSINNFKGENYNSFYSKYLKPFFSLILIWKHYLKGYRVAYINYLPIWNFIIFALLPSSTILGPITGTCYNENYDLKIKFKFFILEKIFYKISLLFILRKWKRLLFSTNMLYFTVPKKTHYKCNFNYILSNFKLIKTPQKKIKKKILIYFRNHPSKYNKNFLRQIDKLSSSYKIASYGENINNINIKNYGKISKNKLMKLMNEHNLTFNSLENLYNFHFLYSIQNNLIIICDKNLKKFNFYFKCKNIFFIDFNGKDFLKKISKKIDTMPKFEFNKIIINLNFKNYFESLK